jgi:hypothetical protein
MRETEKYQQILKIITDYDIKHGVLYIKHRKFNFRDRDAIVIDNTLEISQCEEILTTLSQQSKINELYISLLDNENFYEALQQALPKLSNITKFSFTTPPFSILKSLYQLLSQLENHPTLKSLQLLNCFDNYPSNDKSIFQALASQTFPCLRRLYIECFHKHDIDFLSLITILTKNNILTFSIFTRSANPTKAEDFFSFNSLIKIFPKTHLMNLYLHEVSTKEFQELVRILPLTYIRNLNISMSVYTADSLSLSSQITKNTLLMYEDYSKNEHPLYFTFKDIFFTSSSWRIQPVKFFFHKITKLSIFKGNRNSPAPILNKFIQSLKTIITNIKNSPIYSEYKFANTIPNLWLMSNPILFKRLSILLNHKYNKYLNNKEFKLIQDNRSILSRLTPPSLSQFMELLGYKPSINSPEPLLTHLPNEVWMRFIVPHSMEIDYLQLLLPFATPTKPAKNSTSEQSFSI